MNNVNLVGRLTKDPELRSVRDSDITSLIVATDRPKLQNGRTYKDDSGFTARETEFHKVACFNGLARAVSTNRKKGDLIAIEGRLHYTRWEDAQGQTRYGCEVIAERVEFY